MTSGLKRDRAFGPELAQRVDAAVSAITPLSERERTREPLRDRSMIGAVGSAPLG